MGDAELAIRRQQIIRSCLPPRQKRGIVETWVINVPLAIVAVLFAAFFLFGIIVISASFKKVYAQTAIVAAR